jgi:multiple antibiotic resistance protein
LNPFFTTLSLRDRLLVTFKIALYTFILSFIFLFFGKYILALFGVNIDVVRLGGGIFICKIAWDLLNQSQNNSTHVTPISKDNIHNYLFTPFTFPITMAGGVISVLITLGTHTSGKESHSTELLGSVLGLLLNCIVIFLVYYNSGFLTRKLGQRGTAILNQLCAFFVFTLGLNIAIQGLKALMK